MADDRLSQLGAPGTIELAEVRKIVTSSTTVSEHVAKEVDARAEVIAQSLLELALDEDQNPNARIRAFELILRTSADERAQRTEAARQAGKLAAAQSQERAIKMLAALAEQGKLPEGLIEGLRERAHSA